MTTSFVTTRKVIVAGRALDDRAAQADDRAD
jgi:hypothetical protein